MSTNDIKSMLDAICRAAAQYDGDAIVAFFAPDAVYHDAFYGEFKGRSNIAELYKVLLRKHTSNFTWEMFDPVSDGKNLYARYLISYNSTLPEANNARALMEGVAVATLEAGLIKTYREVINVGTALADMQFVPERMFKIFARQSAALRSRDEAQHHIQ